METLEAYLKRKHEEIVLLNGCLSQPLDLEFPRSVSAVIEQKFRLAAALKAQHALDDWTVTETNWAHDGRCHSGPFRFRFDYQRADLTVEGPAIYDALSEAEKAFLQTTYTASGMAAISALLMALERLNRPATLVAVPGSYSETLELMETFGKHVQVRYVDAAEEYRSILTGDVRIILLDSCLPRSSFDMLLGFSACLFDLVVFDTSCFSTSSVNVRRALNWANRSGVPVVLVRSHTKLDSLGVEYGRLGSTVSVSWRSPFKAAPFSLESLAFEMRKAVRLFGGAAIPAHFPPFVGATDFRALSTRRVAAIIRNNRRMAARLAATFQKPVGQLGFVHGLYVTLAPHPAVDEQQAKQIADALCDDLSRQGLPIRHAGSFGFDFAAAEWFRDTLNDQDVVRIAMADLPTQLADNVAIEIMRWWAKY
jgi:hypothetical protein